MIRGSDTDHVLHVDKDGNYKTIHLSSCPTERHEALGHVLTEYVCPVGKHEAWYGFEDLTDSDGDYLIDKEGMVTLSPGDYPMVFLWYTPESMFEDAEIVFEVVTNQPANPALSSLPSGANPNP